jgi:hypothetical protein
MQGRAPRVGLAGAAVACIVLSVWTVGLPGTLLLAGAWLLAAGLSVAVPGLTGPASWAAAIVVEVFAITGLGAASALISPKAESQVTSLAILAAPGFLGVIVVFIGLRYSHRPRTPVPTEMAGIALAIVIAGLGIARWVASLGQDYGVAWAMSGDTRDEVLVMRGLIQAGGLTVGRLRKYPALVNNVMALISEAGGRSGLRPGDLMLHDVHAVATVYVLAAIAVAIMLMAALVEVMPGPLALSPNGLPVDTLVVLLACAITSASPLLLGMAIRGGFVDGYATLPVVIAATVIALHFCRVPSPLPLVVLGLATLVTFVSWPLLTFVPGALLAILAGSAFKTSVRDKARYAQWAWVTASAFGLSSLLIVLVISVAEQGTFRVEFLRTGAIILPQTGLVYLAGLLALGVSLTVKDRVCQLQMGLVLVVTIVGSILLRWLTALPQTGPAWTYDATKALWLIASSLVWIAFVPALLLVHRARATADNSGTSRGDVLTVLRAASLSGIALVVLGFTVPGTDPFLTLTGAWFQPSARFVATVVAEANTSQPFVFWQWTDTNNQRLGNFWAALAWDSTPSGSIVSYKPGLGSGNLGGGFPGFAGWAYAETGAISQLCAVVESVPHIDVITTNSNLAREVRSSCLPNSARVVATYSTSLVPKDTDG